MVCPLLFGFHNDDTEKSGKTIATPPKRGVPCGPDSGTVFHAPIRPQGVAIAGIYPCGKARKRRPGAARINRRIALWRWLDSYSLAYTVASLLNQLFGKGKEPFWQQAYTNLVRWIIELHRVLPEQWVTLQQVYQCAIDPDLFAAKIEQAEKWSAELNTGEVFIPVEKWDEKMVEVGEWAWTEMPGGDETRAEWSPELENKLKKLTIQPRMVWEPGGGDDVRERVAAVKRWFDNDWQKLDNKIKSSIVEGVSVFLSMFDMPDVAAVFCPPPPEVSDDPRRIGPKARAAILAEAKSQGEASAEKKAQESRQLARRHHCWKAAPSAPAL